MSTSPSAADAVPFTQRRDFWVLMGFAVALGVFGAFVSLAVIGLIGVGNNWFTSTDFGWFGGEWWWVAVTTAAGVAVGLLHRMMHVSEHTSGLIEDLQREHVEPRSVPGIVAVSLVSLIGGASLGPEKPLGALGGGAASWASKRRGLDPEDQGATTLSGFAGAYGGMFSSPMIVVLMVIEIARPGGARLTKTLVGAIVASSISFAIYLPIAGSFFLDAFQVPRFTYEDWQLLAGVGFGLLAAVIVTLMAVVIKVATVVFERVQPVIRATIGGAVFGLVGVALPLTMFTGSDQLQSVVKDSATLGTALLIALVIGKIITFGVCQASGFIGGPVFPTLFIGGTTGVAVHAVFNSVPLGLAFACLFAAVPGAVVSAPFSMVLMAAFMTGLGPLQTAPVLIAVVTAYLVMEGVKYALAARKQEAAVKATVKGPRPDQGRPPATARLPEGAEAPSRRTLSG